MGVDIADFDGDGDLDVFTTQLIRETHALFRNLGPGRFRWDTQRTQFNRWSQNSTGWGTRFFDFDHDGLMDRFVANGKVMHGSAPVPLSQNRYAERSQLIRQTQEGVFTDISDLAGPSLQTMAVGRGAAFGDYDNDGDVDILIADNGDVPRLLRNDAPKVGHWLTIRATTRTPPRDAIGASVFVSAGSKVYRRETRPGGSYCSSSDPRTHVGLPAGAVIQSLTVVWPDGSRESFPVPALNRSVTVHQGTGQAVQQVATP